ncbi:MAG TPA: hypothetical protein VFV22_00190, partial [Candidatus Paceibacterota bacterium]|nr:hypothetical protein [Candidatus Paceibacterota bacterium]
NAQTVGRFTFDVLKKATTNPDLNDVRVRIKKQILAHYEQPAVQVAGAPQPPNPNQAKLIAYNNFFASPEGSAYTI